MEEARFDKRIQLVASQEFIDAVDEWRRHQPDIPNRSEAIRRLVEAGLRAMGTKPPKGAKHK
jgi:hypothetical protein